MEKRRTGVWVFGLMLGLVALIASPAQAATISGSGLQTIFNDFTVVGDSSVFAATDQLAFDEVWSDTATGTVGTLVVEIAGNNGGSFGIYDTADMSMLTLFPFAQETYQATVVFQQDGSGGTNLYLHGFWGQAPDATLSGESFGFWLDYNGDLATGDDTFYSVDAHNSDQGDHMVAYAGTGDVVDINGPSAGPGPGSWTSDEYILAWDDVVDSTYTDYVFMVESVEPVPPVPEPASLALLGLGLLGLAIRRSRSRN